MKKKIITLLVTIICLFIGSNVYAKTISKDSLGNYVISLSSNENIQRAIDSIDLTNDEIKNANGIIIELDGNFLNQQININLNKNMTIRSKDSNRKANLGVGKITISGAATNVTLENLLFFGMTGNIQHEFIVVDSSVVLTMNSVDVSYASRPPAGASDTHLITLKFTENAAGTKAYISNSQFAGIYRAVSMTGSNYDVTFDNTILAGDTVLALANGDNNHITIKNGSNINVGSSFSNSPNIEGISIKSQKNLKLDIIDSTVINDDKSKSNHLFSFDDSNNQNCLISIIGKSSITDNNNQENSKIFDFEEDIPANSNKIVVTKDVAITPNNVGEKYASSGNNYVVGIHDEEGNTTIKIYNGKIPAEDLELKPSSNVFRGWYKNKNFAEVDKFITSESVTENMDLYPKYVHSVTITINGLDQEFTLLSDETLEILESRYKNALQDILGPVNKNFSHFENEEGQKITNDYIFTEDAKLTPIYTITVTFQGEEFTLGEGKTLSDLTASDKERFEAVVKSEGKIFDHFVLKGTNTFVDNSYTFNENVELEAKYNVTITIGDVILTLPSGKTIADLSAEDQTKLMQIMNISNKTFVGFKYSDEQMMTKDELLRYVFNTSMELTPMYSVNIKIGDLILTLSEGKSLNDLTNEQKSAIQTIIKNSHKTFKNYQIINGEVIDDDYKFYGDTEIVINYQITITVDNETFTIEDNGILSSLSKEDSERLDRLVRKSDKEFKIFKDSTNKLVDDDYIFTYDTTLTAIYEIIIKIGEEEFKIDEGKTLNDLTANGVEALVKLKESEFKIFNSFIDELGNTIELNTQLTKNTTIIAEFNIVISIKDEEFIISEKGCLNDLSDSDKEKLQSLIKPQENQEFAHYINVETGEIVNFNTKFSKNTQLEIIYKAKEKDKPIEVPKTYDNVQVYIIMSVISLLVSLECIYLVKKGY